MSVTLKAPKRRGVHPMAGMKSGGGVLIHPNATRQEDQRIRNTIVNTKSSVSSCFGSVQSHFTFEIPEGMLKIKNMFLRMSLTNGAASSASMLPIMWWFDRYEMQSQRRVVQTVDPRESYHYFCIFGGEKWVESIAASAGTSLTLTSYLKYGDHMSLSDTFQGHLIMPTSTTKEDFIMPVVSLLTQTQCNCAPLKNLEFWFWTNPGTDIHNSGDAATMSFTLNLATLYLQDYWPNDPSVRQSMLQDKSKQLYSIVVPHWQDFSFSTLTHDTRQDLDITNARGMIACLVVYQRATTQNEQQYYQQEFISDYTILDGGGTPVTGVNITFDIQRFEAVQHFPQTDFFNMLTTATYTSDGPVNELWIPFCSDPKATLTQGWHTGYLWIADNWRLRVNPKTAAAARYLTVGAYKYKFMSIDPSTGQIDIAEILED